jgi:S1-C subfamily serine protease
LPLAGNCGAPLLHGRGRLIGVNTTIFSPTNGAGNVCIGFAIPVDTVRRVLYGKVVRLTLEISIVEDCLVRSIEGQLGQPLDGCLVDEVVPNGPTVVAGLEASTMGADGSTILGDLVTVVNRARPSIRRLDFTH